MVPDEPVHNVNYKDQNWNRKEKISVKAFNNVSLLLKGAAHLRAQNSNYLVQPIVE